MYLRPRSHARRTRLGHALSLAALLALPAMAQTPSVVYRCPGPPVLYTDALSAKEAQDKGCRTIEGTPITVLQAPKPRPAGNGAVPVKPGAVEGKPGAEARVDPNQQRSRDSDRRKVLENELREAEEKLAALQRDYAGGNPERRGDERNYQKYLDRVAELKANIARQESDIQAIKREISKLP
ncbi:hypothetical protein RQP53_19770 [Paucibacter sp. APW11]|uniref:DUF4124 domain-containing protein n=1 Tax=Roseateles aquae TaxID=3077235 RepID=A0ABU3PG25_9BURK|nr:hypothetical protein [Paucibacter sp. APW11]MDT9001524.1 hypothetical protein [Paucibacter sp. APW11]